MRSLLRSTTSLATALLHRRGWPRTMALRRLVAVALVVLAGALALRPAAAGETVDDVGVVVAAHDLTAGSTLARRDLALRRLPRAALPRGALTRPRTAVGRVLAGPLRAGEPLTDIRLVGAADTALTTGDPTAATVPVRLADPDVADLLRPGIHVDVVTLDPDASNDAVLAENATVVAVRDTRGDQDQPGRLVLVALPRQSATRLAGASLRQPVTVTLR